MRNLSRPLLWGLIGLAIAAFWSILPIPGQVTLELDPAGAHGTWPQFRVQKEGNQAVIVTVSDLSPWSHVALTADGRVAAYLDGRPAGAAWTWRWRVTGTPQEVVFYHSCHTGCLERGRVAFGGAPGAKPQGQPTKLGVVFADPKRNWYGRAGWDVELTYARLAEQGYWGIDELAARVYAATGAGLRVLVRVDYAQGQALPPTNDPLALSEYLSYLQRLARDRRLEGVYGYVIGSAYNERESNTLGQAVTPRWYARLFNGYGEAATHSDNAVQVIRAENPRVRVLVGPVEPWNTDANGELTYQIDVPWLNYYYTLLAAMDASIRVKSAAGLALARPDGFAVQAPGRTTSSDLGDRPAAQEPRLDLPRASWNGAQSGFRVYRDWLGIINAFPTTVGLPVYITASNTYAPDESAPPAQTYTRGWLSAAFEEISREPQVQALCWFLDMDGSGDPQWDRHSLAKRLGRLIDAAEEFEALLKQGSQP